MITGFGWMLLGIFDLVELALGRSFIQGDEVPVFLAILALGCTFECIWQTKYKTNEVLTHSATPFL